VANESSASSHPLPHKAATFVCWGELLWDLFPTGPRLGGSAANAALNLSRFGAKPLLVSRIGRDALGDAALLQLNNYGLDTSFIQRDWTAPTGTVDVTFVDGEPKYAIATESAWDRIEVESRLAALVQDVDGIVYGTLAQRTPVVQGALKDLLQTRKGSCWAVCDLNLRPPYVNQSLLHEALSFADAVKMNESELQRVAEAFGTSDPIQQVFAAYPARVISVTRAERGCTLYTRSGRSDHDGLPLLNNQGDSVGAGDAFTASLAFELVQGTSLDVIAYKSNDRARRVASARGGFGFFDSDISACS
jgi:fructokinase